MGIKRENTKQVLTHHDLAHVDNRFGIQPFAILFSEPQEALFGQEGGAWEDVPIESDRKPEDMSLQQYVIKVAPKKSARL